MSKSKSFNCLLIGLRILGLILFSGKCCFSEERNITFTVNPDCKNDCMKPWLIYGRGDTMNNSIHYLWSAVKLPSFVIVSSSLDSEIVIDWDGLQKGENGSISFSPVPYSVFGISFQTLILFNDKNDTGKLDDIPEDQRQYASLSEFDWAFEPNKNISTNQVEFTFYSKAFRGITLPKEQNISFSITAYGTEDRGEYLPHLITTPESVQVQIALNNLTLDMSNGTGFNGYSNYHHSPKSNVDPISGFDSPRWAFDTIIVSNDNPEMSKNGFQFNSKKSLDDEYTPGVFDVSCLSWNDLVQSQSWLCSLPGGVENVLEQLDSITSPSSRQNTENIQTLPGGFMQWRPVCYLTTDELIADSTYPNFNQSLPSVDQSHWEEAEQSLIYVLFGYNYVNLLNAQTTIAFGLSGDGFYTAYDYTVWTFSMGLGQVPAERFSSVLIIVISVGVGLPFLLFIIGGTYLVIKKVRESKDAPLLVDHTS